MHGYICAHSRLSGYPHIHTPTYSYTHTRTLTHTHTHVPLLRYAWCGAHGWGAVSPAQAQLRHHRVHARELRAAGAGSRPLRRVSVEALLRGGDGAGAGAALAACLSQRGQEEAGGDVFVHSPEKLPEGGGTLHTR